MKRVFSKKVFATIFTIQRRTFTSQKGFKFSWNVKLFIASLVFGSAYFVGSNIAKSKQDANQIQLIARKEDLPIEYSMPTIEDEVEYFKTNYKYMDVTSSNFEKSLKQFEKELKDAIFITYDTEMTGINVTPEDSVFNRKAYHDSLEDRYQIARKSVQNFVVNQVGLCLWSVDPNNDHVWIARPYNFYLFPSTPDRTFLSHTGSIKFLLKNGFDFNKCFSKGITFMNNAEKEKLFAKKEPVQVEIRDDASKKFLQDTLDSIRTWYEQSEHGDEMVLNETNRFRRFLIYNEVPKNFPGILVRKKKQQGSIGLQKLTPEEVQEFFQKQEQQALNKALGFTRVVNLLFEAKKPIVGHNCFLDFMHLYQQFYNPLPEKLDDFRRELNALCPKIVDTKHIAASSPDIQSELTDKSTGLGILFNRFNRPPFSRRPVIVFPSNFGNQSGDDAGEHQAGYDAFLTGLVFLRMIYYLHDKKVALDHERNVFADIALVEKDFSEKYGNTLHQMNIRNSQKIKLP